MTIFKSSLLLLGVLCVPMVLAQDKAAKGPDPKVWNKAVEQAIEFLKTTQSKDGSWGGPAAPGMTGITALGLLRSGQVKTSDSVVANALKYIEGLADEKEGHIAGKGAKKAAHNYPTCVNVMALAAANDKGKYKAILDKAAIYLKELQWDEGEGKKPEDFVYGGAGYGKASRPDLSNTHFFLDALVAAGVSPKDASFKKAAIYASRCQNYKSEHNKTPWAGKINDGSFIYGASEEGETRGDTPADGTKPGYGSMTYAGLKALLVCGVSKEDERCKKALEWITKNYSVDVNPGMPPGSGQRGLYYYLMTMARCLDKLGVDEITDASGKKHDWRAEITAALVARQRKNGSWVNETDRWMENNADLCTSYALIALSYCKK